jgi:hypothetical protein
LHRSCRRRATAASFRAYRSAADRVLAAMLSPRSKRRPFPRHRSWCRRQCCLSNGPLPSFAVRTLLSELSPCLTAPSPADPSSKTNGCTLEGQFTTGWRPESPTGLSLADTAYLALSVRGEPTEKPETVLANALTGATSASVPCSAGFARKMK